MKRFWAVVGAALALCVPAAAEPFAPTEPIMPLAQVRAGMKGYAKTVFSGSRIKSFPVEVLGVVSKKDRPSKLILIRASGPDIDRAGGMASGMSGSPVYVNGRLIGAFSFGWDFGDPKMGLVTPIEQMMELFDYPSRAQKLASVRPLLSKKKDTELERRFSELYDQYARNAAKKADGVLAPTPAHRAMKEKSVPDFEFSLPQDIAAAEAEELTHKEPAVAETTAKMYATADGLSRRALKKLGDRLGMRVVEGGSGDNTAVSEKAKPLKPGDAVSAMLAWGDVALDVSGTLTAVDRDGRFIAFGHSFKNWGAVAYPLAKSEVYGVIGSYESPFKLTASQRLVGTVTQDRPEGIAGWLGRFPPAVSVRVEIEDLDSRRTVVRRFQMINDEHAVVSLLPELLAGLADRELARESGGTVRYDVTVTGDGMPDDWSVNDVVVADEDVMSDAVSPLAALVSNVVGNPYRNVSPVGLKIKLSASSQIRKLIIESLSVDRSEAAPGDTVTVTATLRPWRHQPVIRSFTLKVPEDAAGGYTVALRQGNPAPTDDSNDEPPVTDRRLSSFEQLLYELQTRERSCEVIVELVSQDDSGTHSEFPGEVRRRKMREGSMRIFRSDYVVEGSLQVPLTVLEPKKKRS
ncbi:SpoIVB peptidase S55 domain-containing protein [Pyramidobacter sp. YE332]|uniref:SpoIVB peptidase S55 domain-containing protein n=1 Tax=Pyramidobacter sp. YE332 TaxID=3068894 RepID=UPI00294AD0B2|nr:SpoIVB peptidase S55 domain-containing protein [Pyramidobacter sp. YE332]WOL40584.1 SpoIVB peptidase S55 domain-containing protein [Pyramidobacter sp. YE332]